MYYCSKLISLGCLPRRKLYGYLLYLAKHNFKRRDRFINILHNEKISTNRIINISLYMNNCYMISYLSHRRKKRSTILLLS